MLKENEIKNVISIDDGWSISSDFVEKIAEQGLEENITVREYCDLYAIDVDSEEKETYAELVDAPLKILDTDGYKIPKTFKLISESLNVDIDATLKTLKSILIQLQEQFSIYSGVKFESRYKEVEGNTLFILDKDMGVGREDEFLEYILCITKERKERNDLVIIYSHEVAEMLTHDTKIKYIKSNVKKEDNLAVLYQFWPISKISDEELLLSQIKKTMSKSMYGKALSKIIEMKENSIAKAFEDLLQINIDSIDDMIIESYIEGGKITESYELLIDSLIKKNVLEQINQKNVLTHEKVLMQYEEKRANEIIKEKDIRSKNQYNNIRDEAKQRKLLDSKSLLFGMADYSVNKKYNNPSMGDIYIFTEAKSHKKYAGMLISQECSLVIRAEYPTDEPKRKADELLLLLFDFEEITKENVKKQKDGIGPIKIGDKVCYLKNTKKSMYVCAELLDLCSLNSLGEANMSFDKKCLAHKSVLSKLYYDKVITNLRKKIDEKITQATAERGIEIKDSNISNLVVSLAYGIEYTGNFELRRICRVDEKHTLHIIHEYLNGIAKIGLPVIPNV